ncbi:MAG: hypothetical protein Kow0090_01040 [Myxococcota bacterium]
MREHRDYRERRYLSAVEAARYLDITVKELHKLAASEAIGCKVSASGQKRFDISELKRFEKNRPRPTAEKTGFSPVQSIRVNGTSQRIFVKSSTDMTEIDSDSVHIVVTSPPYFNAKLYSKTPLEGDLGNIHNLDEWFDKIALVWGEVFRVLQPGRRAFVNIMNLPVRVGKGYRTLNLMGRTVGVMEKMGFIFKRDIVWHKTNGVRAHFGTYPYPGGILINNMHEFILEFQKPERKGFDKYGHLTKEQKEKSRLDKEFWLLLKNSDVWTMPPEGSGDRRAHVAPFPLELPYRLIKAFTYVGETALDPFMGSGATLLAAASLERNGVGYEIVPEIARQAFENIKGR